MTYYPQNSQLWEILATAHQLIMSHCWCKTSLSSSSSRMFLLHKDLVKCFAQSSMATLPVSQSVNQNCPKIVHGAIFYIASAVSTFYRPHCLAVDRIIRKFVIRLIIHEIWSPTHSLTGRPDQTKTIIGWLVLPLCLPRDMHTKFLYSFESTSED